MKSKGKYKRNNILNVLENLESVLKGGYWHYKNESLESESESELESEESITERPKLRRQKSAVQPNEQPDTTNIPELERKESAAEQKKKKKKRNQPGKGLKILTPSQMLSRLPIALAQLNAGNNSEKPKNEIRQILYSLYRSESLTKNVYKSLFDII